MADVYTRIGYIKGATGATGAQGAKGDTGDAATIQVGTVTTVPYGQTANVQNSGTSSAAVFDFTIPQGRPGQETTDMQNLTLGSITTSSASFPIPAVGETGKVLWGKVTKWFSDMSALVATKLNIANVVNSLNTTEDGFALDAKAGKTLNDKIEQRIGISGVFGMQVRGSTITNNLAFRVFKNSENTAWTQETINADNTTLTISKKEAGESTDTVVTTIYSAGDIFQIKSYTYNYTAAANAAISITGNDFGISTPSGYSPIGIRTWDASNSTMNVYRLISNATGSSSVVSMKNTTASQQTGTFSLSILYVKNTSL